jgi:hypothetical protein
MGASPPALVADLVERFERDRKAFLSPDCKEEQLRAPCLAVRYSALVVRTCAVPVIHEESIKVAGASKAPDCTFRIGGRRVNEMVRSDASDTSDLSFPSLWSLPSLQSLLGSAFRA